MTSREHRLPSAPTHDVARACAAARADERSKIAERLRARATSEQIAADRWDVSAIEGSGWLALRHEAAARVLREEADALTSEASRG